MVELAECIVTIVEHFWWWRQREKQNKSAKLNHVSAANLHRSHVPKNHLVFLGIIVKHAQFCVRNWMIQRCSYLVEHAKVQLGQQEIVTNMLDNIPQFCVKKLREEERWKIFYSLIKKKCIYNWTCISPQLQEKVEVLLSIPRKGIVVCQHLWHKMWVISIVTLMRSIKVDSLNTKFRQGVVAGGLILWVAWCCHASH